MINKKSPLIGITMGDPCGIGPEVIVKAFMNGKIHQEARPLVIGEPTAMQQAVKDFAPKLTLRILRKVSEADFKPGEIEVLQSDDPRAQSLPIQARPHWVYGTYDPRAAQSALQAIQTAARLAKEGAIDGITTAPINKENMQSIGFDFPGHTEFFAAETKTKDFGMMMLGGGLKLTLASIHLPLKTAISELRHDHLVKIIHLTNVSLQQDFGLKNPQIAVAGLNPHAGENGLLGDEEQQLIQPAIQAAQNTGSAVSGPFAADTLFYKLKQGQFDAAIALYHDQALIPIKLLAFGSAVNLTLGLPIVRSSVDHGTAFDIAGQGIADAGSLEAALSVAAQIAERRKRKHLKTSS